MRDGDEIEVLAVNGYYPFGFMMEQQAYQGNDRSHRYGFQRQEKDDEVKGRIHILPLRHAHARNVP
ncbi:MAG: hypothetical protein ACLFQU_13265 [Candidatus Kapaibacterium sp.]